MRSHECTTQMQCPGRRLTESMSPGQPWEGGSESTAGSREGRACAGCVLMSPREHWLRPLPFSEMPLGKFGLCAVV